MSIVSCVELPGRDTTQNWKRQRTYNRKYLVVSSIQNEDAAVVVNTTVGDGIPGILAAYPTDLYAKVQDRKATQRTDDPYKWDVEVTYSSTFEFDPAKTDENPLARPAIWKFSFEKATKAVRYDLDDKEIANSAEVPIDPPLELETSIPIISITVNKASFSYAQIASLQDCVNSDAWNGFAKGTVKIRGVEVSEMWENNVLFWQYNWTLAVKWDKWRPYKALDAGYHELDDDGEPKLLRDAYGNPLSSPSLLDGTGKKLATGSDPYFLEFNLNREVAFTGLVP